MKSIQDGISIFSEYAIAIDSIITNPIIKVINDQVLSFMFVFFYS